MSSHLRANLWLLLLTVILCSVLYPLVLLGIGQVVFPEEAQGSLLRDENGKEIGSRLIAQAFKGDEYFQPRPSAAGSNGYDAMASSGSNYGASNYLLRDRVARQLGPIVRYGPAAAKDGKESAQLVGPDIEKWFHADRYRSKPGIVRQWAKLHPGLAEAWVKATGNAVKEQWGKQTGTAEAFLAQWRQDFPELHARWQTDTPGADASSTADLAAGFFATYSAAHPGTWPYLGEVEYKGAKRKKLNRVKAAGEGADDQNEIQAIFFDLWRQEHPRVDLLEVPADMVTASASGLDPHITLKNALYQARWRIAGAQAEKLIKEKAPRADEARRKAIRDRVHKEIVRMLEERAAAPLNGLAGVPLVNVLETNLELRRRMVELAKELF